MKYDRRIDSRLGHGPMARATPSGASYTNNRQTPLGINDTTFSYDTGVASDAT